MQGEDFRPPVYEDEIDLIDLVKVVWRRRLFIGGGIVISMCLATILVFLLPRVYRSSGFYRLSSIESGKASFFRPVVSQPEYRAFSACFNDNLAFKRFVEERANKTVGEPLGKTIVPIYAFAGKKTRRTRVGRGDYVTGVELSVDAHSAQTASTLALLFGDWVGSCVLKSKIMVLIKDLYHDTLKREGDLSVALNKNRDLLRQMQRGFRDFEKIALRSKNPVVFMKLSSMQERIMNLENRVSSEELDYQRVLVKKIFLRSS